eukprot:11880091-Alexandrium_andersonii.AAC.1
MAGASEDAASHNVWVTQVSCDGCKKPITGKFQVCADCESVDLCPQCYPRRKTIHPEHSNWRRG